MVVDFLLGLVESWFLGLAAILPEFSVVSSMGDPAGEFGYGWLWQITSYLGYLGAWGVPVTTIINVLALIMLCETSWFVVSLVNFTYNKVRGAG